MSQRAYIGIGSNLDSPRENCEKAIRMIHSHPQCELTATSSFYETEPVGIMNQDWFINAAVEIETGLEPLNLLNFLLSIEKDMGRIRGEKWGPRRIDLDILFYGNCIMNCPQLDIPHPEITRRRFVLAPLAEIAGQYIHPAANKSVTTLLAELRDDKEIKPLPTSG